jgi:DNA-binding NarL/FixJ family response regulator
VIADDHPYYRNGLARSLRAAGIDVVGEAPNGEAAIDVAAHTDPDVVVMDLKMPGLDGLSLIREAKRLKAELPVIIITGFSSESTAIEALNLGVAGYLTKPFRIPEVLKKAAEAIKT